MPGYDQPITNVSETESWKLPAAVQLGRLITSAEGQPHDQTILFRTAEGTKLTSVVLNHDGFSKPTITT